MKIEQEQNILGLHVFKQTEQDLFKLNRTQMLPKLRHDNILCFVFVILDIHLFTLDLSCKKLDASKDD